MSEWMPINFAPKDGTILIGFEKENILLIHFVMGGWHEWHVYGEIAYEINPSHWMRLPNVPDKGEER